MPWATSGLSISVPSPGLESLFAETLVTDEAAISAGPGEEVRVELLVEEGERVAQGQPVLKLRHHPELVMTAPMPAQVAQIDLGPGRRLSSVRFFHEPGAGRHRHDARPAMGEVAALRILLQASGLWAAFRSRPFGRVPRSVEAPQAIVVSALDTRPHAPDPRDAVHGMEGDIATGVEALLRLTEGPVILVQDSGDPLVADPPGRLRTVRAAPIHPWGLAGLHVHAHARAMPGKPVWDIHVEDVAGMGALLRSGHVPETRLVTVSGEAMTAARLVRCQPGADLRALAYAHVEPGPHRLLTGSALSGREDRWLGPRDRQVTALPPADGRGARHWFVGALTRAARPMPLIPSAALEQSLGGALPAVPFLRALASGDGETFARLGGLAFVPEDLELVDYVTGAEPRFADMLAALLERIAAEEGA